MPRARNRCLNLSTVAIVSLLLASCGVVRNGGGLVPNHAAPPQDIKFCREGNIIRVCK